MVQEFSCTKGGERMSKVVFCPKSCGKLFPDSKSGSKLFPILRVVQGCFLSKSGARISPKSGARGFPV